MLNMLHSALRVSTILLLPSAIMLTASPVWADFKEWTWVGGSDLRNQNGSYGDLGEPDDTNIPSARNFSISWRDESGNFWLFGGAGLDIGSNIGRLNDLWRYDMSTGIWTWMSGSHLTDQNGSYGDLGEPTDTNTPGARYESISWIDESGNFWLFGGSGSDSGGNKGRLNDLWRYDMNIGIWIWVGGSDLRNQSGSYGNFGEPARTNIPSARYNSISWRDESGNLWLFGGLGYDSVGILGRLNDLWRYDMSTGNWTWVRGSRLRNQSGSYGVIGEPAGTNMPGARYGSISWIDKSDDLWLFGGAGYDRVGNEDPLNDLWRYDIGTGKWTWMSGSDLTNQSGSYGVLGEPADTNIPGARWASISWIDKSGNLWLFGGVGRDSGGNKGHLNDLWRYDMSTGIWTWESGSNLTDQIGSYGDLGEPAGTNIPGAHAGSTSWMDESGDLWLFGGSGSGTNSTGVLNDFWRYEAPECFINNDCPDGICKDGLCVEAECTDEADCFDGLYCNGAEECIARECFSGVDPCDEREICDETRARCFPYFCAVEWDWDGDCDLDKDDLKIIKYFLKKEKTALKDQHKAEKMQIKAAIGSSVDCGTGLDLDGDCDVDKDDAKLLKCRQKAEKTYLKLQHKGLKEEIKAALTS